MQKTSSMSKSNKFKSIDICQLNDTIIRSIEEETNNLSLYQKQLDIIVTELSLKGLPYAEEAKLKEQKKELTEKINKLDGNALYIEYIASTKKILDKYNELVKVPIKIGKKSEEQKENKEITLLKEEFLNIVKTYITLDDEETKSIVCKCGQPLRKNEVTCNSCGISITVYSNVPTFTSTDRINNSSTYKYERRVHFRDTMNQFQGIQNKKISPEVFNKIEKEFISRHIIPEGTKPSSEMSEKERHSVFKKVNKNILKDSLKTIKCAKLYEDINFFNKYYTGEKCADISHLKDTLMNDFDKLTNAFDILLAKGEIKERKSFISVQYVLYQLLQHHKFKCSYKDFTIVSTLERLTKHNELYKKLCVITGFNYNPLN